MFLVGLHLSVSRITACPPLFIDILGVCLNFTITTMSWCSAQEYCWSIGGELVRGKNFLPLNGKTFNNMPPNYWIGLTDFLRERGQNRSGWAWTDGELEPASSKLAWRSGQPSHTEEDCIRQCYGTGELCDLGCKAQNAPMCQPLTSREGENKYFYSVSIATGLPADSYTQNGGCTKFVNVNSVIECARICSSEPDNRCVSFYFNVANKRCRLVLYTDAKMDKGIARDWMKFNAKQ